MDQTGILRYNSSHFFYRDHIFRIEEEFDIISGGTVFNEVTYSRLYYDYESKSFKAKNNSLKNIKSREKIHSSHLKTVNFTPYDCFCTKKLPFDLTFLAVEIIVLLLLVFMLTVTVSYIKYHFQ